MKRLVYTLLILALFLAPSATAYAATREDLLKQIEDLKQLVIKLTEELHEKIFNENKDFRFERDLTIGSVGPDVEKLQTFLSTNTQFYPEGLVTGYYGVLTNGAIQRLKNEYQITEEGFGEKTREALNRLFQEKSTFVVSTSGFALSPVQTVEGRGEEETRKDEKIRTEDIARDIQIAINQIRVREGLSALDWEDDLAAVALSHSLDQANDNKGLTNPNLLCQYPTIRHQGFVSGFGVRDRVISAGVKFRAVGENIAMVPGIKSRSYTFGFDEETPKCPKIVVPEPKSLEEKATYEARLKNLLAIANGVRKVSFVREVPYTEKEIVDLAVDGWMNSEGHRENILYKDYTHSGIGVVKVNDYYIITENFVGR